MPKIQVKYSSTGQVGDYGNDKELIELSVEIDDLNDYPDTLELLRSRVLENLNLKEKYDKMQEEYNVLAEKFCKLSGEMESAYKQWELISSFLNAQGLKTDNAEFPKEALNSLSKSLPTPSSGYPE